MAEETPAPPQTSFTVPIEGDLARAVQERAARFGLSAEETVRRAVEDMLRREREAEERQRQQSDPRPEQVTVPVACDDDGTTENVRLLRSDITYGWRRDLFAAATKRSNDLYAVTVQEVGIGNNARTAPRKHLLLRECSPDYMAGDGTWMSGAAFLFPVSKIKWLIEALGRAQQALEAEARANRQEAHQARRLRSPEEVDEEREQRQVWTEKRGLEAWQQAVTRANDHKKGALRLGRTSHFTAWEWLELCERCGFRCPLCDLAVGERYPEQRRHHVGPGPQAGKEVRLQPHHRRALDQGGDNTIENILPLCAECHFDVHNFTVCLDVWPGYLETQRALFERLSPDMLVAPRRAVLEEQQDRPGESEPVPELTRHYPPAWPVGTVVTVKPPKRIEGEDYVRPWGYRERLVVDDNDVSIWRPGAVQVHWYTRGIGESPFIRETDASMAPNHPCLRTYAGQPGTDASNLYPLDEETAQWFRDKWTEEQEKNRMIFAVGDLVRPKGSLRTHRSQVMEILPADPVLLSPVRAIIRNTTGKKEHRTVELTELKAAEAL